MLGAYQANNLGDILKMFDYLFSALEVAFPVLTSIAALVGAILIYKSRVGYLNRISIESIFVFFYLQSVVVGSYILYFKANNHALLMGLTRNDLLTKILLFANWGLLFVVAGMAFVRFILGQRVSAGCCNFNFSKFGYGKRLRYAVLIAMLSLLSIGILLIYLSKLSYVALFAALAGDIDPAVARSAMTNEFEGSYHWFKLFFIDVLAFVTYLTFVAYLSQQKKVVPRWILVALILLTLFTHTLTGEKSLAAYFVLGMYFVYSIVKKDSLLFSAAFVKVLFIVFAVLVLSYGYFSEYEGNVFEIIFGRTFVGQLMPSYWYLEHFESSKLFGQSFPNYGGLLPHERYMITRELAQVVFPQASVAMTLPTVFWAEAYANFGWPGVVFSSVIIGMVLSLLNVFAAILKVDQIRIAFLVWAMVHFRRYTGGGIGELFYDIFLFSIAALAVFCAVFIRAKGGSRA